VTDPAAPPPEPLPPHRQHTPASPAEMRRKLLFGLTLLLALASVYAGLFQMKALQYTLAGLSVLAIIVALLSGGAPSPPPSSSESAPR
jgi:hypothetical protein